jgi:hypothetical protein
MSSLKQLYDNPEGIAAQYAIQINGLGATVRQKTDQVSALTMMQVRASSPVGAVCKADGRRLHVEAVPSAQSSARIYFLPWAKGSIYRIRLKPSNTEGEKDNLFFTPNLDGCMVSVEGTPDAPVVYHANSSGVALSAEEEQALQDTVTNPDIENQLKIHKMAAALHVFKSIPPKTPSVSKLPAVARKDFDLFEYDQGSKQTIGMDGDDPVIEQDTYYGAVFGVRKKGVWTFYKQSFRIERRVFYEMTKPFFGFGTPTRVRRDVQNYSVASIQKMWP